MSTKLKTWTKRGAKLVGGFVLLVVLLVALLLLILQTGWGKNVLKNQVVGALKGSLAGSVEVERLDGSIIGALELHGVVVRDSRDQVVARVPRVSASYNILKLVGGTLQIDQLRVDNPLVLVQVYPDGEMNVGMIAKSDDSPGEPSSFKVNLDQAELGDGTVLYLDQQAAAQTPDTAATKALDRWLNAFNVRTTRATEDEPPEGSTDVTALQAELNKILQDATPSGDALTMGALTDLTLRASYHLYGNGRMSGDVPHLKATAFTNLTAGAQAVGIEEVHFLKSAAHLEARIGQLNLGEGTGLQELVAAVDFQTEPDALGNPVITEPRRFIAELDQLRVDAGLVRNFAPDAPIKGNIKASVAVGGGLDTIYFLADAGCENRQTLALGGSVSFPAEHNGELGYDLALRVDDLKPNDCLSLEALEDKDSHLNAVLIAKGRGTAPQQLRANLQFALQDSAIAGYQIERLYLAASAEDGAFEVEPLRALTPYGRVDMAGQFNFDGHYQLRLDIDANEQVRQLVDALGDTALQTQFARIHLDSRGRLDLDAAAPLGKVARADLTARWDLKDARVEAYRVPSSRGEVTLGVKPAQSGQKDARQLDFSADLSARGLDTPQLRAQYLSVDAAGDGLLTLPVDDPIAALQKLASRWQINVRGLSAEALRVQRADLQANLSRDSARAPFIWDLDGSIQGAQFQQNRVAAADLDLSGRAGLQSGKKGIEPGPIAAKGQVALEGLKAGGTSLKRGRVDLDVQGRLPDITGQVDLNAEDLRAGGEEIPQLDANISVKPGRQFEVHAEAQRLVKPGDDSQPGALEVPDEVVEEDKPQLQTLTVDAKGQAAADFQRFEFDQLEVGSPDITLSVPERATIDLHGSGVRLEGVTMESGSGSISIDGQFTTRGDEDLHVAVEGLKLGELREKFALQNLMPPLEGRVDAEVDLTGTAREPILAINLRLRDFYYEGYGPFEIDLVAGYKNRHLDIETFEVRAYQSTLMTAAGGMPLDLNLSGKIRVPFDKPVDLALTVPQLQAENFYEPLPFLADNNVQGSVRADVALAGTVENPRIKLQFDADDFAFTGELGGQEVEIDRVSTEFRATYQPPSVGKGGIGADYSLSWRGEQVVAAHLASPVPVARWVHQVLDETQPIPDFIGALENTPLKLALKVAGLQLDDVPVESFAEADAAGSVFVNLSAEGTFSDPRADFELRLEDLAWNQYRDIDVLGDFKLRNQVLEIRELEARWTDEPVLSAHGKIPLPAETLIGQEPLGDLPIEFDAELHTLGLNRLSVIDYEFARYEGVIAAFVKVGGTLSNPEFDGRAGLFNTRLARGQLGTISLQFEGSDNRIQAAGSVCRATDTVMEVRADLPVNTDILALAAGEDPLLDGPLHATVKSDQLRLSELFPEELVSDYIADPKGTLTMDVELEGTWEKPLALGTVRVDDAALTLPYFGRRFTDINLNLEATQEALALRKLHIGEDDTSITAQGVLSLENLKPTKLSARVKTQEFSIAGFVPKVAASITSEVDITGDLSGQSRQIRTHITKLEVTMPETAGENVYPTELDEEITVLSRQRGGDQLMDVDALIASNEVSGRTRTAIRVIADRGSWLHHPMADVEFRADITATLGGPQVQVTGSIDTIRGSAEPLGKDFDVPEQENAIRFTGDSPPDPALDIRAIHMLDRDLVSQIGEPSEGEPRIIIHVRGRASEPTLVMESDPAMSETEILYVLMTGRPPNKADAGEESRVSSLALGAASGIFAGMLQDRLSGTLPLDVVRLQPGEEGFRDLRVQVGKYVTDDIFVSYVLRLGADEGEGVNVIKLDYRFLPSWKLGFQLSNQLNGDLNVFWDIY